MGMTNDPELVELAARLPDGYEVRRSYTGTGYAAYLGGVATPRRGGVLTDTADELVAAVAYQASTVHDLACCPKAVFRKCVCYVSFECPDHGTRCHGTHD